MKKEIKVYVHNAKYYETDQMGIVHHSNYIRWMEEARVDLMEQMNISYGRLEEMGIVSPVLSVECKYKNMVHFNDDIAIYITMPKYNGIKMEIDYEMINIKNGEVCTLGHSSHCYLNKEGRPITLKNEAPEFHESFLSVMGKDLYNRDTLGTVDLHVHSDASDGTMTPTEVVNYAKEKKLYAIALTDHDTVDGVKEAIEAAGDDIHLIPGIEISANYEGTDLHILGYNVDYNNKEFLAELDNCRKVRAERNLKMINKMNDAGFPVTEEIMKERYGTDAVITRAHFARYLLEEGYVSTKDEAFEKYLGKGKPLYVPRTQMTPETAVKTIKNAGGHPVLAHPMLYNFDKEKIEEVVVYLKGLGIEGIEGVYSMNTPDDDRFLKELADKYGLFITGGSDFHGTNKPHIDLGVGTGKLSVPKILLMNLERR